LDGLKALDAFNPSFLFIREMENDGFREKRHRSILRNDIMMDFGKNAFDPACGMT